MPMIMQCPFYKKDSALRLNCEGCSMKFPDAVARNEYVSNLCANLINWKNCSVAQNLQHYYDRKGE